MEYKRFISYVYIYIDGKKHKNIGYTKVEVKNYICKITINIRYDKIVNKELDINLFYVDKEDYNVLIEMKKMTFSTNICECVLKTDEKNLFNTNKSLDNMNGIMIKISDNELAITQWDDVQINLDKIKKFVIKENNINFDTKKEENNKNMYKDNKETGIKEENTKENTKENNKKESELEVSQIKLTKEESKLTKPKPENIQQNNTNIIIKEQLTPNTTKCVADRIFEKYPGMYPFDDDEIIDCVKLEPQDIGILPMDKWVLASNSFLLHGYYTYRHLIFARKRTNADLIEYILGVPGIYKDRDRFMASMFGFTKFKGIHGNMAQKGDFGYWFIEIKL